jgi:hypothetical protein
VNSLPWNNDDNNDEDTDEDAEEHKESFALRDKLIGIALLPLVRYRAPFSTLDRREVRCVRVERW